MSPSSGVQRKKKSKKHAVDAEGAAAVKRGAPRPEVTVGGAKRRKQGVLASLFHEDGEGTHIQETYLCRSVGGRGLHLS